MQAPLRTLSVLFVVAACGSSPPGLPNTETDAGGDLDTSTIVIRRDSHGIPHIEAATDEGAMYGLGYATAEDRLLHMNLMVLAIQGRFSESLGRLPVGNSDSVESDRKVLSLGYWRHAQSAAESLPADTRALLDAYAAGVNQYIADRPADANALMADLAVTPQQWTAAHSIGVWYWVGRFFSPDGLKESKGLHDFEAQVRDDGLTATIEAKLCDSHPGDPSAGIVQAADVPQSTQDAIAAYALSVGQVPYPCPVSKISVPSQPMFYDHLAPKFSHAWAVGGANTTTGSSVLISDPQTPVAFPAIWHEMAISGPTLKARGVTVPGNPGILIGWNENIAWGLTAAGADQTDLFRIEMAPGRADAYLLDRVVTDMVTETVTLKIKGEADQSVVYRETVFGPMVTEFASDPQGEEFAARFVPFAENPVDTVAAFIGMMRAASFEEFNSALDGFRFPSVNLVAGDVEGNTMYRLLGAVPVRSARSPLGGSIAQEGNSIVFQWQGSIPGEFMPQVTNPSGGNVLSANHRATGDWYPISLGLGTGGKGDSNRSARIRELLAELPQKASPQEVLDLMQNDCVEVGRRDVANMGSHLSELGLLSADAESAVNALASWRATGGQTTTNADGAFLAAKMNTKFRLPETGPELATNYGGGGNGYALFTKTITERLAADPDYVPTNDEIAFVDNVLSNAWTAASTTPQSNWTSTYSAAGETVIDHFALIGLPGLGSEQAESVSLQCLLGGTVWSQSAQSYTQWVDLSNVDGSAAMMPLGNTENVASEFAQSQSGLWASGELRAAPLSISAIEAITQSTQELQWSPL